MFIIIQASVRYNYCARMSLMVLTHEINGFMLIISNYYISMYNSPEKMESNMLVKKVTIKL